MRARVAAVVALAAAVGLHCADSEPPANVLLYVVDTLRADAVGAYTGGESRTPALDGLAREGVLFERAYAPSSWTRASMASLLTGTLPSWHGTEDRSHHLPPDVETLGEVLKRNGYETAFVTANPNVASFFGFAQGFDDVIELYDRRAPGVVVETELVATSEDVGAHALEWLARAPRPFFLVMLSVDPHFPYTPPEELVESGEPLIDNATLAAAELTPELVRRVQRQYRRLYRAEVAFNDRSFAAVLGALRASGELDRTIVVFTSDHGEEFWERGRFGHGFTLHDEVLRVPLVLRYPGSAEPGRRVRRPVGTVDVVPTLLDLLGLEAPGAVRGRSLLEGPPDAARPLVASLDLSGQRWESLREGRWKLLRNRDSGETRLYDTDADPHERAPLRPGADEPARLALARLERDLDAITSRAGGFDHAPPEGAAELPEGVGEALEALGYAE